MGKVPVRAIVEKRLRNAQERRSVFDLTHFLEDKDFHNGFHARTLCTSSTHQVICLTRRRSHKVNPPDVASMRLRGVTQFKFSFMHTL